MFLGRRLTKRAKRAAKKAEEEAVRQTEQALAEGGGVPTSADGFDRLLLGSPHNSYIWVQYAAFYLQVAEIDKARSILERALQTISFREEKERANIWVAKLNLEMAYGTPESLMNTFTEATRA